MARKRLPECNFTTDGRSCRKRGDHFCPPRAQRLKAFVEEILVHTKGRYKGRRFVLAKWQWLDIMRPLFGSVVWSEENEEYVRQYSIAWIEIARKNGKTELLAAMMLYLLVSDDEHSAEIYGIARDKDQAALAFDVAKWMVMLSPTLSKRLRIKEHNRRIVDPRNGSAYAVIAADANSALGSNPSGVAADEILAWRDGSMWDAMRTGMGSGARRQPLMVAATTAGTTSAEFALEMHNEMVRVQDTPERAPHVFSYIRNTPMDADPWDERNWHHANPALGDFLSMKALRDAALEVKNSPRNENGFRQFRLNQWVAQATRWMSMRLYDASAGEPWLTPDYRIVDLLGRQCYAGLDLAARQDLCAWCLIFPDPDDDKACDVVWRFWLPEAAIPELDDRTDGKISRWVRAGWITTTEGNVLDYQRVYADIAEDVERFEILALDADRWSLDPVVQAVAQLCGLDEELVTTVSQTYVAMTPGMTSLMDMVVLEGFRHHANPVARWCFDNVEVRVAPYDPDLIRPDKPERHKSGKRIDAVPTASMAVGAWKGREIAPAPAVPTVW